MASSLVIKVQHDGTLRRFNASIKKNGELDLDMVALKTKILGLFDFPADADLKLTYIDEEGDVVTLVDDDDLSDIAWQNLAFLRINVVLNKGSTVRHSHRGSAAFETKGAAEVPLATKQTAEEHAPPKDGCENMFSLSTLMQYLIGFISAFGGAPPPAVDGGREATQQPEAALSKNNSPPQAAKLRVPTIQEQLKENFLVVFLSLALILPFVYPPSILLIVLIIILIVLIIKYHRFCRNQLVSMP